MAERSPLAMEDGSGSGGGSSLSSPQQIISPVPRCSSTPASSITCNSTVTEDGDESLSNGRRSPIAARSRVSSRESVDGGRFYAGNSSSGRGCDIICVFTYVNLQLLLLLSFILVVYTSIEVDDNSDHNITLSTSEAFSLTEWANYSMNLYSKQVCIERLKKNELNELTEKRVTVHMEKRECYPDRNKIINRMIKNVFESTSSQNARLDFFWIKDTKLQFFIDITSDAIPGEELTAYILDAEGHGLKIECDTFYNNSNRQYVFPFSGSSSHVNVTCSLENNTSKCYSTPYAISKTRRYYVCMRFSAANIKANVSYSIHINETTYDLTNSFSKPCPLNMSDCCLSYRNILVEIFNPTCVFIKNEAVGHHNQAKELPFPLTIATESKWDGTLYSGILGAASLLFSMTIIFCRVCCYLYRRTHPDEYCLEIRCAPAKIHLHV